jgi:glycosyltransferase involved in cell wall biosynthesis
MAKVLIIGVAPLPFENQKKNYALNNRTWFISKALLEEGHAVRILASRVKGAYGDDTPQPDVLCHEIDPGLTYYSVERQILNKKFINRHLLEFDPDCIIGVGTVPSASAVQIKTDKPVWADLFGSLLAEAQVKAKVYDDDFYPLYWRRFEEAALKKADVFSAVSTPQKFAVIGELSLLGRLNKYTTDYEFVHVVPIALDDKPFRHTKNVIRDKLVKKDDFVILWSGGYNTWTDVDTLFSGLIKAMMRNDKIKFVSTGGAIDRHDEISFTRFREKIRQSEFAQNFVFLGWISTEDVENYYFESDIGINIDRFSCEAMLGARNRITEMWKAGLPILTTRISEISHVIGEKELGLTYPIGDSDALAAAIGTMADDPSLLNRFRDNMKASFSEELSLKKIMRPITEWARDPRPAPDRGRKIGHSNIFFIRRAQYLVKEASIIRKKRGIRVLLKQAVDYARALVKGKFKNR